MANFGQNLRFALRQLRRNPGFTVTVVATLALAIGANTAIFSIVNALMLRGLPYAQPDRMGAIFMDVSGSDSSSERDWIDGEQWEALRDNVPSLEPGLSSAIGAGVNLETTGRVEYVHAGRISAHYLDVLRIHPAIGRNISELEDHPKGAKVVVLSYSLWRTTFNADPNLIGQSIHLKGEPYTVIGILPRDARTPLNADVYTPLQPSRTGEGEGTNYEVIVRLRDGATWQQANAELNRAWEARARRFAAEYAAGTRVTFHCVPLQAGQSAELRPKALALMSAAGFILLIACANLAGLTLVRMARRTPEIVTRIALGASRWQVQKQVWIETLLLAAAGGIAGIGLGYGALRGLLSLLPQGFLPVQEVPLDLRVLAFTMATALATSILFGMLPAFAVRRVDLRSSISTRSVAGGEGLRLRQFLIAGEVALTAMLLAGSGLLIRTLIHLETLPPGFNPNGILTAKASLDDSRYHDPAAFARLLNESVAAMQRIPAVQSAAVGLSLPYERSLNNGMKISDGKEAGQELMTGEVYVTPSYFDTLQIPLLGGRIFTSADTAVTQRVAIVNQTFARKFFPRSNPIGRVVDKNMVIVGVVGDVQVKPGLNPSAPIEGEEMLYIPATQVDAELLAIVHIWFQPSWIVRTAAPLNGLNLLMQRSLANVDPGLPFSGFHSMTDLMNETLATQRVEVALLGVMAGLALVLSLVGIFALVASLVAQRTREIGIRIALGSTLRRAMADVAGVGLRASLAGMVFGIILSMGALRAMRSVIYGVGVYDPATILSVLVALTLATLFAATLPALRIAQIDPAKTLREE